MFNANAYTYNQNIKHYEERIAWRKPYLDELITFVYMQQNMFNALPPHVKLTIEDKLIELREEIKGYKNKKAENEKWLEELIKKGYSIK